MKDCVEIMATEEIVKMCDGETHVITLSKREIAHITTRLIEQLANTGHTGADIEISEHGQRKFRIALVYDKNL